MLVEHDGVKAHLLRVHILIKVHVVEVGGLVGIVEAIGKPEEAPVPDDLVFGRGIVGALGKVHQKHETILSLKRANARPG